MKLRNSHVDSHKHEHTDKTNAISIDKVTFRYAKKEKYILENLSINIKKGTFTTILGPNGSGKSTLVKAIVKANKIKSGEIKIHGNFLEGKEFAQNVAYIPQIIEIPGGISVYDFISFGRTPYLGMLGRMGEHDKKVVENAMKEIGVWQWKDKMTEDLSGGERQRVLVAMALAQETDIVILDEPTTYLDIRAQYELLELLDQLHDKGKTIVAILHDINQAVQYSDELIVLKEGKLYTSGIPEKVVTEKMLQEVYGVKTKLYKDGKRKYLTDVTLIDRPIKKSK